MNCELILMLGYFVLLVSDEVELNSTAFVVHRNVVGYIGVRFTPQILRVSQHDTATGQVHVTVHSHRFGGDDNSAHGRPPALHACVVKPSVAAARWSTVGTDLRPTDVAACSSLLPPAADHSSQSTNRSDTATTYSVTVRGVLIGRSAVRFYVTKTQTTSKTAAAAAAAGVVHSDARQNQTVYTPHNDDAVIVTESSQNHVITAQVETADGVTDETLTQYKANGLSDDASYVRVVCNVTDCRHVSELQDSASTYDVSVTVRRWWLANEWQIVVVSPVQQTTANLLYYVIVTLTAVNLIGIGGQLDCDEATQLLRRPSSLAVGLFCRLALVPAVSLHRKTEVYRNAKN